MLVSQCSVFNTSKVVLMVFVGDNAGWCFLLCICSSVGNVVVD